MRQLSDSELLAVWERGYAQPYLQRALSLLQAADPGIPFDSLAQLSIGQRDARLLRLRELTFGTSLTAAVHCPACRERLEFEFRAGDLVENSGQDGAGIVPDDLNLVHSGFQVRFRLPNNFDLVSALDDPAAGSMAERRQALLQACILEVNQNGERIPLDNLPEDTLAAVIAEMSRLDPQADIQFALSCPACNHRWSIVFDILSFFWAEIETWAYRTLHQVHTLASVYGWGEADILGMSLWRRQLYLEMVSPRQL